MDKEALNRPLRVADLLVTRKDDAERGPMIVMSETDAKARLITDGELAWIYGPTRHELATVHIDPALRQGDVILRDVFGARPSEYVRVIKPDLDSRGRRPPTLA